MGEITLYRQDSGARVGKLTEAQFKVLTTYLRLAGEDVESQNQDHRVTRIMVDIMRRESQRVRAEARNLPEMGQPERGARAETRAERIVEVTDLLLQALGDQPEVVLRWQKD